MPVSVRDAGSLRPEVLKVWRYKWWVTLVTGAAGLCGLVYIFVVTPEYQSVSGLVPPNLKMVKSLNFQKLKYEGFGSAQDEDLERVSASLKSDTAFQYMVRKFDLARRYGVADIENPERRAKRLSAVFESKITVRITALSTIEVQVYDVDPKLSADIANEYVAYADSFVESVARRREGIIALERSISDFEAELKRVQDTVAFYRGRYRLYHLDNLSEAISQQIAGASFNNPGFSRYYDKVVSSEHRMRYYDEMLSEMINELVFRKENLRTYPSLNDVVSHAVPSEVRARPKRLLTVVFCALAGFVLSVMGVVFLTRDEAGA